MEICLKNPFRILGLTATATERQITKRISDLIIYAEMKKQKSYDLDLGCINPVIRTPETIEEAKKKIEQPEERIFNSLFWLWSNTSVDQLAFDYLKESNVLKAVEILEKGTKEKINEKNFSTYINLSVLYLLQYRANGSLNKEALKSALMILGDLFSSPTFLVILSRDIHYADRDLINKITTRFVNVFLTETNKEVTPKEVIELLGYFDDSYKDIAIRKFTSKQIDDIENEVQTTKIKREKDVSKANVYANELNKKIRGGLSYIETILTRDSVQYEMVADKVVEEILLCSIAFFNYHQSKDELDPGEETIKLMEIVKEIGIGAAIKKRINDNLPIIKRWITDKPERDAYLKCWYCGVGVPDKSKAVKVPMHLVVLDRIPTFDSPYLPLMKSYPLFDVGPRTIRYRSFEVEINRCYNCAIRHKNNPLTNSMLIAILVFFLFFFVLLWLWGENGYLFYISFIISVISFFIMLKKFKDNEKKRYGNHKIRLASNYNSNPIVKQLLKDGWEFGVKPPNVE